MIEPVAHEDTRGFFFESYRQDEFERNGIRASFVQENHSGSVRGVLRGLHYQIAPYAQAKLIRVLSGEVFDVVVDCRRSSATFGRAFSLLLSAQNRKMIYIPEGFAHGFMTLSDNAEFLYKVSRPYSPAHERGIRWDDPRLAIPWPNAGRAPILSPKDTAHPSLSEAFA